jgi:hypothetical protein
MYKIREREFGVFLFSMESAPRCRRLLRDDISFFSPLKLLRVTEKEMESLGEEGTAVEPSAASSVTTREGRSWRRRRGLFFIFSQNTTMGKNTTILHLFSVTNSFCLHWALFDLLGL